MFLSFSLSRFILRVIDALCRRYLYSCEGLKCCGRGREYLPPPIRSPVTRQRQVTIRLDIHSRYHVINKLVALLTVTRPVCKLKVVNIRRVTAFINRDNVVNSRRHRVRIFQALINWLAAYSADILCEKYPLAVFLKQNTLTAFVVGTVLFFFHFAHLHGNSISCQFGTCGTIFFICAF